MAKVTLLIIAAVMATVAKSDPIVPPSPVLKTSPGFLYNPASTRPAVTLEVFVDLHCSDSRDQWPTIKGVQAYYTPNKLDLRVHQLPLPYHRNAFLASQGLYLVRDNAPAAIFDYMEANWANLESFVTSATVNKTDTEVIDMLANLANGSTGIDAAFFKANINNYRSETVATWKYALRRGNYATPQSFVNGVELGLSVSTPTLSDWTTLLDPIINSP